MPKKVFTISQWEGGQNSSADPRDIDVNEAISVNNLSTNRFGRLVMSGKFTEHESTLDSGSPGQDEAKVNTSFTGTGLFSFSSDYNILNTANGELVDGSSDPTGAADFFLLYHTATDSAGANRTHSIFQKTSGGALDWSVADGDADIKLGGATANSVFFNADGAVRIFDADGISGNVNKWLGIITPKVYGNHTPLPGNYTNTTLAYSDEDDTGVDAITDSSNQFITKGFKVGQSIDISGFTGDTDNNTSGNILTAVTANKISFASPGGAQSDDAAGESVTISPQTYQEYSGNYTRNEASVYRTSNESGTSAAGDSEVKWVEVAQELKGAFPLSTYGSGNICVNAILANTASKAVSAQSAETFGFGFADELTDTGSTHFASTENEESNMYWGVGCEFREGNDGTWMPTEGTRYKFYISTLYDDGTQESLPQLMAMYGAQALVPNWNPPDVDVTAGSSTGGGEIRLPAATGADWGKHGFHKGQIVSITDSANENNTFASAFIWVEPGAGSPTTAMHLWDTALDDADPPSSGARIVFGTTQTTSSNFTITGHEDLDYTQYYSGIADDKVSFRYSTPSEEIYMCAVGADGECNKFGKPGLNLRAWFNPVIKINGAEHGAHTAANNPANSNNYVFGNGDATSGSTYGNPRISGFRIYWASNEDGYATLWQMMEGDFAKGLKAIGLDGAAGESGWAPWQHYSVYPASADGGTQANDSTTTGLYLKADWPLTNRWVHPPRFVSYHTNNGHEHTDTIKLDAAKTIVVANRRAYAGNVVQTIDGVEERHPDRILKSPINQFDKFPSSSFIECAVNDGDSIVHLATFADRLLQFNKEVMYVINIAQESEFLETKHAFKGISHPSAVCTTDLGVAWANEHGAYFYDGSVVKDILESNGRKVIPEDEWATFATDPMVGYVPKTRQVIFADSKSTGAGKTFIYDMINKSFTRGSTQLTASAYKSNFTNDYNGDLIYYDYANNQMMKWNTTAATSTSIEYITKDIDFGNPSVRKKIYKAYITYKGNGTFPTVTYGVNGNAAPTSAVTTVTAMSNNDEWAIAEYKFGSDTNNCYSFQLKLAGNAPADFEINDISIVYRDKRVK